jgi:type II secretory pathway pseudopilin PulG
MMDEKKKRRWLIIIVIVACAGVVGLFVLGIIAGIAVPAWQSSRRAANESATIYALNTVAVEEYTYRQVHGSYGTFDQLIEAGALDKRFAGTSPVISGYVFMLSATPKTESAPPFFSINADPQQSEGFGATGKRHFYKDSTSGYTHYNEGQSATPDDPVLETQ